MVDKQLKDRRLQLMLTEAEAEEVAEFRWRHRIPSQSDAVRQLIAKGLKAANEKAETASAIPAE